MLSSGRLMMGRMNRGAFTNLRGFKTQSIRMAPTSKHLISASPFHNYGKSQDSKLSMLGLAFGTSAILAYQWNSKDKMVEAQPRFSKKDTTVVFILGGPGAGKGTQCAKLVQEFGFVHLSAGDLLREERIRPGSQFGDLINNCMKEGKIVPMQITISLLENAMAAEKQKGNHRFLVDGFPRMVDQGQKFEEEVCESTFVLFFDCPEAEMEKRLLGRSETSGRVDDNIETIRKRFKTFIEATMPVIDYYEKQHKVKHVSCLNSIDSVYKEVSQLFREEFRNKK